MILSLPMLRTEISAMSAHAAGLGKVVALILTKPRTEEATSEQEGGEVEQTEIRAAS